MPYKATISSVILSAMLSSAAFANDDADTLSSMSLKDLLNVEVTSVHKKSERASEAPAAVYVITQEDIRRSGATSIVELLRYVPGLNVGRAAASQWAVSSRGFNDQFANKLLVLIDGRTVYTPLFSGVYWDVQNQMLENIERIEVVRGPGATLWGANAVNGVINIITKDAEDTQGGVATTMLGNDEYGGSIQYGDQAGEGGYYRAYAMHHDYDESLTPTDNGAGDDWMVSQGGFRYDRQLNERDKLTVQGDYYEGDKEFSKSVPDFRTATLSMPMQEDVSLQGGNLLVNWERELSTDSVLGVKAYYDHTRRISNILGDFQVQTFDLELQHAKQMGKRHDVVWGLGYRLISDDLPDNDFITYSELNRNTQLFNGFFQDKIMLVPKSLFLTLGSKVEHNDYTGTEFQPNARISWLLGEDTTLWGAVSRAVRTPNRNTDDISFISAAIPATGFARLTGDKAASSENMVAYEMGFRSRLSEDFAFDLALFYNDYEDLASIQRGTIMLDATNTLFPPHAVLPLLPGNAGEGQAYGAEFSANWHVMDNWRLAGSYSFLRVNIAGATSLVTTEGSAPEHQFAMRSYLDLPHDFEWDHFLYFNDNLSGENIDSYLRFDTRLGWTPVDGVEVSIMGRNLLDDRHPEFSPFIYNTQTEIGRSVYGKLTFRF